MGNEPVSLQTLLTMANNKMIQFSFKKVLLGWTQKIKMVVIKMKIKIINAHAAKNHQISTDTFFNSIKTEPFVCG